MALSPYHQSIKDSLQNIGLALIHINEKLEQTDKKLDRLERFYKTYVDLLEVMLPAFEEKENARMQVQR